MKTETNDLVALIALKLIKGIGGQTLNTLALNLDQPSDLFKLSQKDIKSYFRRNVSIQKAVLEKTTWKRAEQIVKEILNKQLSIQTIRDEVFSQKLKMVYDPPTYLFHKGKLELNDRVCISIVGTRQPNEEAHSIISELIEGVSHLNPVIISGLARGVDTLAHKISLDKGLQTIGVMGSGFDHFYPASNKKLAHKMIDNGGAVVTEFFNDVLPLPTNFPVRNRIVAGMADCTVVIQSASKGGSLITAHLANGYGREVFAYPGSVLDQRSSGTNGLIHDQLAQLVRSSSDLIESMHWKEQIAQKEQKIEFPNLSELEQRIVNEIPNGNRVHLDELARKVGLKATVLNAQILNLELRNVLASHPGKYYSIA